jgi:hypothetical protein
MDATDVIAGYAAVVATAALGWEIRKARQASRPQVEVDVTNAMLGYPSGGAQWSAHIQASNHGDLPVRVAAAGFKVQDGSGMNAVIHWQQPGATIPGVVEPRDSGFTYLLEGELGRLDLYRPLVG